MRMRKNKTTWYQNRRWDVIRTWSFVYVKVNHLIINGWYRNIIIRDANLIKWKFTLRNDTFFSINWLKIFHKNWHGLSLKNNKGGNSFPLCLPTPNKLSELLYFFDHLEKIKIFQRTVTNIIKLDFTFSLEPIVKNSTRKINQFLAKILMFKNS